MVGSDPIYLPSIAVLTRAELAAHPVHVLHSMDHFDLPRNQISHSSVSSFHSSNNNYQPDLQRVPLSHDPPQQEEKNDANALFMKGPKRKRLAKACDACHRSKRRCDGTAPCSNCFYASKQCTYTDASGRPVPAPRPFKSESTSSDNRTSSYNPPQPSQFSSAGETSRFPPPHRTPNGYPPVASSSSQPHHNDEERTRKRFRNERSNPVAQDDLIIDGPISGITMDRPAPLELDPSLTRELTNLFFAHCHPARAIIHKPNFSAALSHNRVPSYLLHAVCALAAPLSKQPRIRTTPSRYAGKPFAQEALSLMFDGAGRLVCEPNLATAQALSLLQMHDILVKDKNVLWNSRYHDLALQIVDALGVHSPEHPTLTPVPSAEFIFASIEREAIRRIFWLIHLMDVMAAIYFKKPITFTDSELRLRLPVDETSFELGVHSTLPEYLYLPAVRTQYASEFGHLIRVISIYAKVELALDELNGPEGHLRANAALIEAEQKMEDWARTLPEHLRFSEQSLLVQQSMFETSSNTGAWCWCCIHVYHASCALGLNVARQRSQRGPKTEPHWALQTLDLILNMLGDRAKNSILMGAALWSLIKYCKRDDAQVRAWSADYEESWGTKIADLVQEWRPQPSPPHQYLHASQQHQNQNPLPQHQQPTNHHSQLPHSHRRLSEARNPGGSNPPNTGQRPPPHQHAGDASSSHCRSSSSSPTSLPLGRSLDELRLHNNNPNSNRPSSHSLPDPRDSRTGSSLPTTGSNTGVGPPLGHGGNENQKYTREKENGSVGVGSSGMNGTAQQSGSGSIPGGVAGGLNENTGQRNLDGPQSLPSLKASGLLDSWNSSRMDLQKPQGHGANGTQASPQRSPPMPPIYQDADMRPATLGMPVGLQWLANESR